MNIGRQQLVLVQTEEGMRYRWLCPVLDEHGGWTHWITPQEAMAMGWDPRDKAGMG